MTFTDPPPGWRPATDLDDLRPALATLRDDVASAATTARRSLGVAWESEAAGRFRAEVGDLLAELDGDLGAVEHLAAVLGR